MMRRYSDGYFRPDREAIFQNYLPQEFIHRFRNVMANELERQFQPQANRIIQNNHLPNNNLPQNNNNGEHKVTLLILIAILFFVGVGLSDCECSQSESYTDVEKECYKQFKSLNCKANNTASNEQCRKLELCLSNPVTYKKMEDQVKWTKRVQEIKDFLFEAKDIIGYALIAFVSIHILELFARLRRPNP